MWIVGAVNYSSLTFGLEDQIEAAVTYALPVMAVLIAAALSVRIIRRLLGLGPDGFETYEGQVDGESLMWDDAEDRMYGGGDVEPYYGDGSNSYGEVQENNEENYEAYLGDHDDTEAQNHYPFGYDSWRDGYQRD